MSNRDIEVSDLLRAARQRGSEALGAETAFLGMDQFAIYTGLLGSALELGKLLATEGRDLRVIESHHEMRMAEIALAFKEVEGAMLADFERDQGIREKTFEMINRLIDAGQFELALEAHRRLIEGNNRSSLSEIIDHRNNILKGSGSRMFLK
jgi:hypothetical protein